MSVYLRWLVISTLFLTSDQLAFARGFGGGHAGGFHGGGFAGGAHLGGMGGAHFGGMGGVHPGGFGGGFREGGGLPGGQIGGMNRGMGGIDRGGFDRGELGGFSGGAMSGYRGLDGARPGEVGGFGAGGYRVGGFDHSMGAYGAASRGDLNRFLGLPTDAGMNAAAGVAGRGFMAEGPRGGAVAAGSIAAGRGFRAVSPASYHAQGWAVRRGFGGYGWYGRDWYRRYPGAWWPAGWYAGAAGAWAWCTWASLGGWFGYSGVSPMYYNYGSNFVYDGDDVYYNGQPIGTAADYYDQANTLAAGAAAPDPDATDWLPLGVFSLVESDQTQPSLVFQLAVNKAGTVRGNCSKPDEEFVGAVQGAVDKEKQRVAWTVGDDKQTIYETGLYNLTKDEAPALVHRGADNTEQWLLVRMKQPE
ncbi:MAG TPA: hypothetical protein VG826_22720 [Pirellulales bacterium]|nr:hypothetical protein [Pirellulales bacterium]